MAERKRRHRWRYLPDAQYRDDLRYCARPDCGMLRSDLTGAGRYEYRTSAYKYIATRMKTLPAPPCLGSSTQKDTTQ